MTVYKFVTFSLDNTSPRSRHAYTLHLIEGKYIRGRAPLTAFILSPIVWHVGTASTQYPASNWCCVHVFQL